MSPTQSEGWSCHEEKHHRLVAHRLFPVYRRQHGCPGGIPLRQAHQHHRALGPGGGVDIAARILADYFQQNYNITINVVNKPGGAQAIGINEMLRARPDGYTLAFPGFSALATTPKLTNVGYTLKNIKPVAHIASMECVLSTNKSSGMTRGKNSSRPRKRTPMGPSTGLPAPSPRNACT